MLNKFFRHTGGNFALTVAIVSPVLLGVAGLGVDVSTFISQQARMQETADTAVLAAIREAAIAGWDQSVAEAVVVDFIQSNLDSSAFASTQYTHDVAVDKGGSSIKVTLQQNGHGYLLLSLWKNNPQIEVSAKAFMASSANICVLTLEEKLPSQLLSRSSKLTGVDCGVFANSESKAAINVDSKSSMTAEVICSAGGFSGAPAVYSPDVVTDCPVIPDPLAGRAPPPVGSCDYNDTSLNKSATLYPGVYCGGISAQGNATITLEPGIYVIKDGPLTLNGNATLTGENVGFYMTGSTAKTGFGTATTVSLSAPKSGPMAGILFFEDRNAEKGRLFVISSKDARKLVGTIYLPKGFLYVGGSSKFADASAWTAIVSRAIMVDNGPAIVLNSDYKASDIPVPEGIAAESGKVSLIN